MPFLLLVLLFACKNLTEQEKVKADLAQLLTDLKTEYAYQGEKEVDWDCLAAHYGQQADTITSGKTALLLFEYLLDEFYDSHLILNANTNASYRLFAPIYTTTKDGKNSIANVWQTQITNLQTEIIGAVITKWNGIDFQQVIETFPTNCHDKKQEDIRNWIANKVLAGRYNQPRVLSLQLKDGQSMELDLDQLVIKPEKELLSAKRIGELGYIRIHNSLGEQALVAAFDKILDGLMDTKGLVLDLRNTVDGGNTTVARPIMGRLISEKLAYQKHRQKEKDWVAFVTPRGKQYTAPVVVLVDRWTGSMGEGLAIGLEGMNRAEIVGTEMERLAGAMNDFPFKHRNFSYRLSTAQLFHMNGTPRAEYTPTNYVVQTMVRKDEILQRGLDILRDRI